MSEIDSGVVSSELLDEAPKNFTTDLFNAMVGNGWVRVIEQEGRIVGYVTTRVQERLYVGLDDQGQMRRVNSVEGRIDGDDTEYGRDIPRDLPFSGIRTAIALRNTYKKVNAVALKSKTA